MLCPKGVKRYLQGSHPDRLVSAQQRDPSSPAGFRPIAYEDGIRSVADNLLRIQTQNGPSSVAVLSGASLTTEKTYLMGKFARMCLKTSNIDYNGRLCMVSAAAGNKKAFGIDRAANPWSDILKTDVCPDRCDSPFRRCRCGAVARAPRLPRILGRAAPATTIHQAECKRGRPSWLSRNDRAF